jgi:hypothetical protein
MTKTTEASSTGDQPKLIGIIPAGPRSKAVFRQVGYESSYTIQFWGVLDTGEIFGYILYYGKLVNAEEQDTFTGYREA